METPLSHSPSQQMVDLFEEPALLVDGNLDLMNWNAASAFLKIDMPSPWSTGMSLEKALPDAVDVLNWMLSEVAKPGFIFEAWHEAFRPLQISGSCRCFFKFRQVRVSADRIGFLIHLEPLDDWGQNPEGVETGTEMIFFETDMKGRVLRGGERLCSSLGFPDDNPEGMVLLDLFAEECRADMLSLWQHLAQGGSINGREVVMQGLSGEPLPFGIWLHVKPGAISRVRGVILNISAQKSVAYALEAAEERFNVLYRESSDPVFLITLKGEILSVNRSFEALTGLHSADLFLGDQSWSDFVHADDLENVFLALRRCVSESRHQVVEYRLNGLQGSLVWHELGMTVLHNEEGEPRGVVAVSRDIHQRKKREEHLQEHAGSLEEMHRRAQILIGNLKKFFTRINELPQAMGAYAEHMAELLYDTYRPGAVLIYISPQKQKEAKWIRLGKKIDLCEEDPHAEPLAMCRHVMDSGLPLYVNSLDRHADFAKDPKVRQYGFRTYLGAPLRDSKGGMRGTVCLLDNKVRAFETLDIELLSIAGLHIASRLRAEEQEQTRKELEEHLQRASKMEAVGMLAGGVAHDFNNIIGGILGYASYLGTRAEEGSSLQKDLKLIELSAVKAAELTRQLLVFSRHRNPSVSPVSINDVIQDVIGIMSRSLSKDVRIHTDLDPGDPRVEGDPGQLNQVVMNLALNAFEAMALHGGDLHIVTRQRCLRSHEKKTFPGDPEKPVVCMKVIDTGRGMSEDLLGHIFDPFFTTKSDRGGSGLGLSMVYGIVRNHGGQISVKSREGEGTQFVLLFSTTERISDEQTLLQEKPQEGGGLLMIVDDELILRQMVTEVLKGNGYQVVAFQSGDAAVRSYPNIKEKVRLVILDMVMPGMNGYDTFTALRGIDPDLPILLSSGFARMEQVNALVQAGAFGFLQKPYKSEELLATVASILAATE